MTLPDGAPIRRVPWQQVAGNRLWPTPTQVLLVAVGLVLAATAFMAVLAMPQMTFHPARDLELRSTYASYRSTGVLLVKVNGTGSWYGKVDGSGLTRAAGDDDPGTYVLASLMSHVTHSDSPYPGLALVMAALVAAPLLLLPVTVARVYRHARAGYALLVLPPLMWLINYGTVLIGTQYGLWDSASPTRVYALYGLAASTVFAALVLLAYLATRRLGLAGLVGWSVAIVAIAAACNLNRSMSGVGVAAGAGVLWWIRYRDRRFLIKGAIASGAAVVMVVGAMLVTSQAIAGIERQRADVLQVEASKLPAAHGLWHPFYLGLSYPQPINGTASRFGVVWSDEFGWNKAREVDPDVRIASEQYDRIIKDLYLDVVRKHPMGVARLYAEKLLFTVKHFAAMIVLITLGFALAWRWHGPHRRTMLHVVALSLPTMLLGLVPAVVVMPLLYYFSELTAALSLLVALALGGLVWGYTSLPSFVRAHERRRLTGRDAIRANATARNTSVIVPTRNGASVLPPTLQQLGERLGPDDEIIVVENGSTDATALVLADIADSWIAEPRLVVMHSPPGLGNAYREGVRASSGRRVVLSADDLPFGCSDLDAFESLPADVLVAIGSKAHPASVVDRSARRELQSRLFRWLREALLHSTVGDSQGTFWVDGDWARMFAELSREEGLMWTVELVLAAERQGSDVWEVPVVLTTSHDGVPSRFTFRDARVAIREILRLALQKDEYVEDDWQPDDKSRSDSAAVHVG